MASGEILVIENKNNADPSHGMRTESFPTMETISSGHYEVKRRRVTHEVEDQSDAYYDSEVDNNEDEDVLDKVYEKTQGAIEIDPVNERLSALQHLLPDGLKLEEDEILRVAVEYVKELEREIQMFDTSTKNRYRLNGRISDAPLQKRGLCIVPLSTLAKAL